MIELKFGDTIEYEWVSRNYGRAEFQFCTIFRDEMLTEMYIYRIQQENIDKQYHLSCHESNITGIYWDSVDTKGNLWRNLWCCEHHCLSFEVYVPENTSQVTFSQRSNCIRIDFK